MIFENFVASAVPSRSSWLRRTGAAVIVAIVVAVGCARQSPPAPEREERVVPVGAVPAERGGIRATVAASGVVTPAEGAEFLALAPEPARIIEVLKNVGDTVQSGDMLVRFDLPVAAQELARIKADIAASQALFENARINESRVRDLAARGLIPRRDVESAERETADAEAVLERQRESLAAATAAAGRAVVRAPFDGIVAERRHSAGDLVVSTEDPVLRVVDPRRLEVIASVAEADAARVVVGATARIAAAPDAEMVTLHVAGRVPGSGANERRFRLLFAAPASFSVDMPLALEIDAEERTDAVLIPAVALIPAGDGYDVMIASGTRAEKRAVETGVAAGDRIEITEGIRPGELVIVRGHIGLEDGAAITVAVGSR